MSLVKMAEAAGIGKVGKNGLLFSSKYGPRLILGGIVTTAKLPSVALPDRDEKGCPEGCHVCQEKCPVKAIDRTGRVDRITCTKYSMKSPIFSHFMERSDIKLEDIQMINHLTAVDDHSAYRCIKCVALCPYL